MLTPEQREAEEAVDAEIIKDDIEKRAHGFDPEKCSTFFDTCNCPTPNEYLQMRSAAVRRELKLRAYQRAEKEIKAYTVAENFATKIIRKHLDEAIKG